MSDILQPGNHPDADQLSAFIEHALPLHEQEQTLAHLSVCSDCRSVVALSLPPLETSPKGAPEPVRRPWFSGWNLAWAGAVGLAGLVFAIVHVNNIASSRNNNAAPSQMASSHSPTPLLPPTIATNPEPLGPHAVAAASSSRSPSAGINNQNIAPLPVQNRNTAGLKQYRPSPPNPSPEGSQHASIGSSAAGLAASANAPAFQAPADKAANHSENASKVAAVNLDSQSADATPAMSFNLAETAAAPPPAPVTASQAVQAGAAAPLSTFSSLSNRAVFDKAKSTIAQHPLPSQLPAISVASNANQILAIDTRSALFFSEDGGNHWKAVAARWQGRAVKVDLASPTQRTLRNSGAETGEAHTAANIDALAQSVPLAPSTTAAALTGLVTDPAGATISGASVVVSNSTTANLRTVKTDITGRYLVDGLAPGSYKVEANALGFNKQQLAVTLAASQKGFADLTLAVGQSAETVTVEASTVKIEPSGVDRKKALQPLPQIPLLPVFEITTDTGEHWTSTDGQNWKRQ